MHTASFVITGLVALIHLLNIDYDALLNWNQNGTPYINLVVCLLLLFVIHKNRKLKQKNGTEPAY